MLGWDRRAPDRRTFGDIYRRQYQQTRASRASKLGRVVGPILLPIAVVLDRG
jgi:hypothetical protein